MDGCATGTSERTVQCVAVEVQTGIRASLARCKLDVEQMTDATYIWYGNDGPSTRSDVRVRTHGTK